MTNTINKRESNKLKVFSARDLDEIPQIKNLPHSVRAEMKAVSSVLPFRANNYVVDELIDWNAVPDDPIFQLTFPQAGMLDPQALKQMLKLTAGGASQSVIQAAARDIQLSLNPHPAAQKQLNVPSFEGEQLDGMQHKYRETVLFFPSAGQTCFSYCTYCFRWPQFVGIDELKFASRQADTLVAYLKKHREVKSVLFTGGDPLIMKSLLLRTYIEPLLIPELEHITSIRIGTKAPAFWPYRFVTDDDAGDLLRLFEQVRKAGKNLALMAHYSHPRFLSTDIGQEAVRQIQNSGATIRCQSPVVKHVNDDEKVWSELWAQEIKLGAIPYYMFVERDTGARRYFELPLERCLAIYNAAYKSVSGLGRTVRGPSMSCTPGKVMVDAITEIAGEKVFVLKFIQARDPAWVNQVFFAKFDPEATWMNQLKPAFGKQKFFFEEAIQQMLKAG